ncbi:WXG100 family type VII secretion target [Nocardia sp. NPDC052566]|uniref:WXG100 family type VII secretion target n=1 Tax=Nocardia sp. NPDC052566 TaxID=3364330 RepID=UPI0037C853CC
MIRGTHAFTFPEHTVLAFPELVSRAAGLDAMIGAHRGGTSSKDSDMTEHLEVSPNIVRRAGGDHDTVRERLQRIVTDAYAAMSVGSAAWSADKFGTEFAYGSGGKGFVTGMDALIRNTENMARSFEEISGGQHRAAAKLERTEHTNTGSFGRRR